MNYADVIWQLIERLLYKEQQKDIDCQKEQKED